MLLFRHQLLRKGLDGGINSIGYTVDSETFMLVVETDEGGGKFLIAWDLFCKGWKSR